MPLIILYPHNRTAMKNILFVLAGLVVFNACSNSNSQKKATTARVRIEIATAEPTTEPLQVRLSGNLEADRHTRLSTRQMGQVSQVFVRPGMHVHQGQLLVQLRQRDLTARLKQVQAEMESARTNFQIAAKDLKRYKNLHASQSASDKELENARSAFQQRQAELTGLKEKEAATRESLHYTAIRAPYPGVITEKYVQPGDMAIPGKPLISLESNAQWKVFFHIPEAVISHLKINDPVRIVLSSVGISCTGTITELNSSGNQTGTPYVGKILLSDLPEPKKLYSGMYADVTVTTGHKRRLMVSRKVVFHQGQLTGLFMNQPDRTVFLRWVRTGIQLHDSVEILSGLNSGESYVTSSQSRLADGTAIEVISPK